MVPGLPLSVDLNMGWIGPLPLPSIENASVAHGCELLSGCLFDSLHVAQMHQCTGNCQIDGWVMYLNRQ